MATYSSWADKKNSLIRKALTGSVFIASSTVSTLGAITTTSSAGLVSLPTGWKDLGYVTKDGVGYGRETAQSEVTSFGSRVDLRWPGMAGPAQRHVDHPGSLTAPDRARGETAWVGNSPRVSTPSSPP
jgi:hypothetical protein